MTFSALANFIWSVADLLRRLECVLEPTKAKAATEHGA